MSNSVSASQDALFRGKSVWVNHPERSFCSLNSFSVKNLPITKHQLAISNAKWTCKQFKDFEEVVKLTVGNFRRSWVISTLYECRSGWSICHCCFVIVLSHVACGSIFIEKSFCYGLLFLFSPSKLSITCSLLDGIGLCLEEQLHSFLSTAKTKQIWSFAVCATCKARELLPQVHATLSKPVSLILFLKMNWVLANITALWAYLLLLRREYFFYLENAMKKWFCN